MIGLVPGMTTAVAPFLLVYGISYFFTEFGPNVTTFVLPGELFPTSVRATGHGISAGIGKFGAFVGVFLFPVLQESLGLRGTLLLTAGVSASARCSPWCCPSPPAAASRRSPARTTSSRRPSSCWPRRAPRASQKVDVAARFARVTRNMTRWLRPGTATSAARRSPRAASTPGSALLAAGSHGTART